MGYDYAATSTTRLLRGHRLVLGLQFDPGGWRTVPVKAGDMPDTSTPQATIDSLAGWRALLDRPGARPARPFRMTTA